MSIPKDIFRSCPNSGGSVKVVHDMLFLSGGCR